MIPVTIHPPTPNAFAEYTPSHYTLLYMLDILSGWRRSVYQTDHYPFRCRGSNTFSYWYTPSNCDAETPLILYRRNVLITAVKSFKGKNAKFAPLPDVKAYREAEVWLYSFLTSATDRGWMVILTLRSSYPKERVPGAHWIRGWVGSTTSVYCCRRDQSLALVRIQTPDRPARSPVIRLSTLSRFLMLSLYIIN